MPGSTYRKSEYIRVKQAFPKRKPFQIENIDYLLQEILADELRHQKRCEEFITFFRERVKGGNTEQYETDVNALIKFIDMYAKFKPITLKVIDNFLKLLKQTNEKLEEITQDLDDALLDD